MTDRGTGYPVQRLLGHEGPWATRPKAGRSPTKVLRRLSDEWAKRSLSTRFVIVSTVVIFTTMLHLGAWMDGRIRASAINSAKTSAARYMEQTLQDHLQSLATERMVSPAAVAQIKNLMRDGELGRTVLEVKIWRSDGTLVYSANGLQADENAVPETPLRAALAGQIATRFDGKMSNGLGSQSSSPLPILEVYVPIRSKVTQQVIGATEFYEDATALSNDFTIARQQSWIVIGSLTFGMLALLFGIVHRGSLLILEQKRSLEAQLKEKSRLLKRNQVLQSRLLQVQQQTHELSDKFLQRLGADLHDGPAQLLSLAMLRLNELEPEKTPPVRSESEDNAALSTIKSATHDALQEIRCISSGLSLPQLDKLTTAQTVLLAVDEHKRHTKTKVDVDVDNTPIDVHLSIRTCLYRCIQEGLTNAFRHAGGKGQRVAVALRNARLRVTIADQGQGFCTAEATTRAGALGLTGLRNRVECLGGSFNIISVPGEGTTITISLPYTGSHDR